MSPDLEKRVPREILEELIEKEQKPFEGSWRSCSTWPCSWKKRVLGSGGLREDKEPTEGIGTDSKAKRIRTRVGELRFGDSPGARVEVLSQVAGERLPFGEGPEAGRLPRCT